MEDLMVCSKENTRKETNDSNIYRKILALR